MQSQDTTVPALCGCGCGAEVRPGKRFIKGHWSRLQPTAERTERTCPVCGKAFLVKPSQVARGSGIYCSFPCSRIGHRTTEEKFWAQVQTQDNGCWLWTGHRDEHGYGTVMVNRTLWRAHRYAWTLLRGPIPVGLLVCHDCPAGDNPSCVNPGHLFLGTDAENKRDSYAKGRRNHLRGSGHHGAVLTEAIVREMRALHRAGGGTFKSIGERFGVAKPTARQAIVGETWRHIKD